MGLIDCLFPFFNFKKFPVVRQPSSISSISSDAPSEYFNPADTSLTELCPTELKVKEGVRITVNYKYVNEDARISVFPILRLPLLSLKNCLRVMELSELIDFSWCSKATRELVRAVKCKPDTFLVEFDQNYGITLTFKDLPGIKWSFTVNKGIDFEETDIIETRKLDDVQFFAMRRTKLEGPQVNYFLLIYPGNTVILLKNWIEHFTYIFNSPITLFTFCYNYFSLKSRTEALDYFFNIQSILDYVHFIALSVDNDLAKCMLDRLKISKFLNLEITTESPFQYRNEMIFNVDELFVIRGEWITIENILFDMKKCKAIDINRSKISDEDLNVFIKSWIDGNHPQLEFVRITRNEKNEGNVDEGLVLNGTNFEEFDADTIRMFERDEKQWISVELVATGGYDIRNKNGVMASCLMGDIDGDHNFVFSVWTNGTGPSQL